MTSSTVISRARKGRALVELLVASLILCVATSASLRLLQATATFADRVVRTSVARDLTRDAAEKVQANPCTASNGQETRRRTLADWQRADQGAVVTLNVVVTLVPHPFELQAPRTMHAIVAGWCD